MLEFRVGHIRVEGNRHFPAALLRERFGITPGERMVEEDLETGLERLNANPFRRAELLFERGKRLGESDLILSVRDRFPFRAYAGYENTGVATLGRGRWFLGFNWGNAFGRDHLLSYQLTTSSDFWTDGETGLFGADVPRFVAHAVTWRAPLSWGHELLLSGVYAEVDPELPTPFRAKGETIYASVRYELPLPDWRSVEQKLAIGADYKRTDNNLAFGGQAVLQNAVDILQGVLTYSAAAADDLGSTELELSLVLSPGGITSDNTAFAFRGGGGGFGRPGAEADRLRDRPPRAYRPLLTAGVLACLAHRTDRKRQPARAGATRIALRPEQRPCYHMAPHDVPEPRCRRHSLARGSG